MKSKVTQALVERAPRPEPGKSVLYADTEMRGFYLIVTLTKRSFYVQSLVNGRQVRTKLGDHPTMDAKQVRDAARQTLVGMRGSVNPNEERRRAAGAGLNLSPDSGGSPNLVRRTSIASLSRLARSAGTINPP